MNGWTGSHEKNQGAGGRSQETRLPIIAMTAHAMQGDKEKCLEAGMDDYVPKPVAPPVLAEVLEKWLPKQEAVTRIQESAVESQTAAEGLDPSPVVFDRAAMLERFMGDEELAETIAQVFLADILQQIEALRNYLEAGDAAGAERQAHTIKGASANVGGGGYGRCAGNGRALQPHLPGYYDARDGWADRAPRDPVFGRDSGESCHPRERRLS